MNLTAVIGTTSVQVTALDTHETIDGRSVAKMTVYDAPGTAVYEPRTPVLITDSLTGYSFSGYVNDDQTAPDANGVAIWHTLACVDESDLASKRYYSGSEWQNRYAGDIATDIVDSTLSVEGVTANFAIDEDNGVGDWQEGTQTNTAAVQTATGGALELALAGANVTKTESTTANWNAGTLSNTAAANNALTLASTSSIKLVGSANQGVNNNYVYYQVWNGSQSVAAGDTLQYDVWISSTSPQIMAAVDGMCSDGTSIRDFNSNAITDQNGNIAHPNADLSGYANDTWYHRQLGIGVLAGKTLKVISIAFEGNNQGTYQAYFRHIKMFDTNGTLKATFYESGSIANPSMLYNNGYANVAASVVTTYQQYGNRISPAFSISAAGNANNSLISWQATTPAGTALEIDTSIDGGATWQTAANYGTITNLLLGCGLTGRTVSTRQLLSINGTTPEVSPSITNITFTVTPTSVATKTDVLDIRKTLADWQAGTANGTGADSTNDMHLNGYWRNWDDALVTNQTLYGTGLPFQGTQSRTLLMRSNASTSSRSRIDFAGSGWADFTFEMDCFVDVTADYGIVYRTTGWQNADRTWGYLATVSQTQVQLGRGTNTSVGAGGYTAIVTPVTISLSSGSWHRLKVVASGSTHQVYVDNILYITATDAAYLSGGYVGIYYGNNGGSAAGGLFDNFGIVSSTATQPTGTWTSPQTALTGISTVGDSAIFWDADLPPGFTLLIEATSDNGTTWNTCTNGGRIPVIGVPGFTITTQKIQYRVTFTATNAGAYPFLGRNGTIYLTAQFHGITAWITSQYTSTGNRISVPLSLAAVGTAGNTAISWQGVQPPNTTILVDTSLDGTNWSNAGIGASGQASIAGILTQTDPVVDDFSSDTSNNYTSTSRTGGSVAAWVWDVTHNRLTVSGGVNAHLLYNSPTTGADVDISAVLDTSDNGGFVWRWLDQGDHYALAIHDASSPNNPNTAQLYVVTGGGGGTITPLTEYETSVTSATVGTMKQLSRTLGTGAFTTKQSTIGTSTGYGELFAAGTTNAWAAGSALLDPSTNNAGWIDDGITLEGQTLVAGVYSPTVRLQLSVTATITADIYVLYFKRASGGAYTPIGTCVLASQTVTGALATYNLSGSLPGMSFATGDKLVRMVQLNITSNTNGLGTLACKIGMANAANTGITVAQDVTPGFQLTGTGGATTLLNQVAMSFPRSSPHVFRVVMVGPNITITMDGNPLITTGDTTISAAGFAGFRNDNAGGASSAQFYLFRLQYYGQNVTSTVVLSRVRFTSTDPTATPQLNQYSMSVHDPSIQEGALIPQTSYSILGGNKKTIAAIYDDLAAQSGNFWWKIIAFQLFFQQHQATPAPWVLTPQGATGVDIVDSPAPTLDNINDTYRNSQWGTGGTDIIAISPKSFVGNGTQTTFDLGYNIDTITSITLGGAVQTFGIANSSTGMNWYYTQGQSAIIQDTSAVPISGVSQVLTVAFNAQVTISVNVQSPSEITRVGNLDNTTGIIDEGEPMSGLNKAAMIGKCAGLLTQFGQKSRTLTFTTRRSGLAVGQLQCAFVGPLSVFAGAFLLTDIKGTWRAEGVGDGMVTQTATFAVSGTSGPITLSWQRFVDSLGGGK